MKRIGETFARSRLGFYKQLLFSYIIVLLTVLLLFSGIVYAGTAAMLKARLVETATETVQQAALNIRQYMQDVEALMFNISVNSTVQNALIGGSDKTDFETVLEKEKIISQLISVDVFTEKTGGVYLFSENQHKYPIYRVDYLRPEAGRTSKSAVFRADEVYNERWYVNACNARGRVVWETPEEDSAHKQSLFSAARGILNNKNVREVIGVVRVFVEPERFESTLRDLSFGAAGMAFLVSGDTVVGAADEAERLAVLGVLPAAEETVASGVFRGERSYIIRCDAGEEGWQVVGVIPERTMLTRFDVIKSILVPALLAALLLAVLLVGFNAYRLSRPIHQVADAMRGFETDRARRFTQERNDEIGVLYRSFNRMMDRIDILLREVQETSQSKRAAELQALQAQINPHFLYNTLDCIQSIACLSGSHEIVSLTTALSAFFRISLNKGEEILSLRHELQHVQAYCEIQHFRSTAPFTLHVEVEEQYLEYTVIKLILQPLVENAIIHGFTGQKQNGEIVIRAREADDFFLLQVEDNGAGADVEYLNGLLSGEYKRASGKPSSYGIINVEERLRLTFGRRSGLHYYENAYGGVTAEIRIVLRGTTGEDMT